MPSKLSMHCRLAALAAMLACVACTSPQPLQDTGAAPPAVETQGDVNEGRRLAEVYCASCHAIGTEGESRHPMSPPFRTLSRDYPVTALEEAFAEGVLVGHPDMPEFQLEPQQIEDLLSYIESIQERQAG
jgi:mono/diheme cytochrome c family protein